MTRSKEADDLISTAFCCENVNEAVHFYGTAKDELAATIRAVIKELDEAKSDEAEQRKRALLAEARVRIAVRVAGDMLSTFRHDDKTTIVTVERQEAWKAELDAASGKPQSGTP